MKKRWMALLPVLWLFACKKDISNALNPSVNVIPVTVTLDQTKPGFTISPTFEGLSFETAILCRNAEYLNVNNKVFVQLVKNLGPGLLRIGGNTSDEIDWKSPLSSKSTDLLSEPGIDRLAEFSKETGWKVLLGLNMGSNQLQAATDEAVYANTALGDNLYALQAGNEPDIYSMFGLRMPTYGVADYTGEWEKYFYSLRAVLPQAAFAGPGVSNHVDWVTRFADAESLNLKLIDAHYYYTGPASSSAITYYNLLQPGLLPNYLSTLRLASEKSGLPYRITECNNVYGGGKGGVSNVFVSALWALDFMWIVAENNGQGINFHDGHGLYYSPITMAAGNVVAHPEYYAMLAFKYGNNNGKIIPAILRSAADNNCQAYACINADNTTSLTLINKEETNAISYTVKLNKAATNATIMRLTAPSLTSKDNVTFGGSMVNADGTFAPNAGEQQLIVNYSFTVKVPAGSAAVITIR